MNVVFELGTTLWILLIPVLIVGAAAWVVRARSRGAAPPSGRLLGGLVLLAAGIGWSLFGLSAMHEPGIYLGPLGIVELQQMDGFDPWTGEPHGRVYLFDGGLGGIVDSPAVRLVREPAPESIAGRRAIPVWVGFGMTLAVGGAILAGSRRRRVGILAGA